MVDHGALALFVVIVLTLVAPARLASPVRPQILDILTISYI